MVRVGRTHNGDGFEIPDWAGMTEKTATMSKTKKILIFSLFCLGAVFCLAVFLLPRLIHTDLIKGNLENYLSQRIHRQVRVKGDLSFRVFPWVGFRAQGVQVANPAGFGSHPMISCGEADIRLELNPLLHQRIVFKKIFLEGARVHLARNRYGKTNWQDLLAEGWGLAKTKTSSRFVLDRIEAVHLRGATLVYSDDLNGRSINLSGLRLERKGVVERTFRLGCRVSAKGAPIRGFSSLNGDFAIDGNAFVDLKNERLAITRSHLSFPFAAAGPGGRASNGKITAGFSFDTAGGAATLTDAVLHLDQALAKGHLRLQGIPDHPSVTGRIEATTENLSALLKNLAPDPQRRWWTPPGSLAVSGSFGLDREGINISGLRIMMDETVLTGKLRVRDFFQPRIEAALTAGRIELDRFRPVLIPAGPAPASLSATDGESPLPAGWFRKLNADVSFAADAVAVADAEIQDLKAHFQTAGGRAGIAPLAFAFAGGRIQGDIQAAALDPATVVRANFGFEDLPAAALFKMAGRKPMVEAALSGEARLFTEGRTLAEFRDILSGTIGIRAPDGMVIYPNGRDQKGKMRVARAQAKLAAYVHDQGDGAGSQKSPRSFALTLSLDALAPALKGTLRTHGIFHLDGEGIRGGCPEFGLKLSGKGLFPCSPLDLDGRVYFDTASGQMRFEDLSFTTLGLAGSGRFRAGHLLSAPVAAGHLQVDNFDPQSLFKHLQIGLPTFSDPSVFRQARVAADFHMNPDHLLISDLAGVLDDTRVTGVVAYDRLARRRLSLRLDADALDLDRYLPMAPDRSAAAGQPAPEPDPVHRRFRDPAVQADLTLARLKVADLWMDRVRLSANMANGRIDGRMHNAELYGGAAIGDLSLDLASPLLKGSAMLHLRQISLEGLLMDLFGWVALTGDGSADMVVSGKGKGLAGLAKNLTGQAKVTITDGAIQGVRVVPDHLREKADPPGIDGGDQEPFDSIQGTVLLKEGVLENTDGVLGAGHVLVDGTGTLNLYTDILDYAITADITGYPMVRYSFVGPLDDIQVNLDRAGFARETAVGVLKSPFRLGKGTLDIGTEIIDLGKARIGSGTGPQRVGQGALGVGRGVLDIGKGLLGFDAEGVAQMGEGARELGRGVMDVGKGVVDTGVGVFRSIGGGLEKIFSGEKGKATKENGRNGPEKKGPPSSD